jgi:uncharacterized protein YjbI with pentapeptide repeats
MAWQLARGAGKSGCPHFGERQPVANDEHLALLRQGTAIWNEWRDRNPGVVPNLAGADLSEAELPNANLNDADLIGANLSIADLEGAQLRNADLSGAHLIDATLSGARLVHADLGGAKLSNSILQFANLSDADLSNADLSGADLSSANLSWAALFGTNFTGAFLRATNLTGAHLIQPVLSGAILIETIFASIDLHGTVGLDECSHHGPSVIDFRTLYLSGDLPLSFLRGCGLTSNLIEYLPSLRRDPIPFYSCFISYSAKDHMFAERLYADLQNNDVRCWFAPHDLPIGAKISDAIDEAIRVREKLLVILSEGSIASDWVEDEVNKAYAEERERRGTVLFPIRIDDTVMTTTEHWARKLRDQRNIGDFRHWKEHEAYQKSLDRLLRDLKTHGTK